MTDFCPRAYRFLDAGVSVGSTYFHHLEAVDRAGASTFFGPLEARMEAAGAQLRNRLGGSRPNPFGGVSAAAIEFELARPTRATLGVFDAAGGQVRLVLDRMMESGTHVASWDGRNDRGASCRSGIYFYRLEAESFSATQRLVRLE